MQNSDLAVTLLFYVLIAAIGAVYSLLGQGGGSGYLAVMAFFGLSPATMKPAALTMNIFVTAGVVFRSIRQGDIDWRFCRPFLLLSIPMAFIGGVTVLQDRSYQILVGTLLLLAAVRLFMQTDQEHLKVTRPGFTGRVAAGGAAGFLGGLSGIGGGILLSPFLIFMRWCTLRENIALSAVFVLVNSMAALSGLLLTTQQFPFEIFWMVLAALVGSLVGFLIAKRYIKQRSLYLLLGAVLIVAGLKLIIL
ncbi:MAG: sulfite exporter TauE/SafE family protein [Arenicellales bacterium]|nr:sulfite exporter TauE/SafE family protein [Arenicellales bacterium]